MIVDRSAFEKSCESKLVEILHGIKSCDQCNSMEETNTDVLHDESYFEVSYRLHV